MPVTGVTRGKAAILLSVWSVLAAALSSSAATLSERQVTVLRDLRFAGYQLAGSDRPLLLDLYLPESPAPAPLPVIVYLHGGGWFEGSKSDCPGETFARSGYAVACVAYRLADADGCPLELTFPAQVDDVRGAVRWLREHAERFSLNPGRFSLLGDSSGGHLALLAGLWNEEKGAGGAKGSGQSAEVQAIGSWYGPVDVIQGPRIVFGENPCTVGWDALSETYGGEATPYFYWTFAWATFLGGSLSDPLVLERARRASPLAHVGPEDPPVLLIHGQSDGMVPISQSELAVAALNDSGVEVVFVGLADVGHGYGPADRTVDPRFLEPTLRFLEERLQGTLPRSE